MRDGIAFTEGLWKYQLKKDYHCQVGVFPSADIKTDYIELTAAGGLLIGNGYCWDGPSGPTIDTANFMRGSLVHDALYQLMRNGLVNREMYRVAADRDLQRICLEDGMSRLRAGWVFLGVHWFGKGATEGKAKKKVRYAPGKLRSD